MDFPPPSLSDAMKRSPLQIAVPVWQGGWIVVIDPPSRHFIRSVSGPSIRWCGMAAWASGPGAAVGATLHSSATQT